MLQLTASELLTYSTVRIECRLAGGGLSTGTGFFFRFLNNETTHVPAIVTNKHVVEGAIEGAFKMHEAAPDEELSGVLCNRVSGLRRAVALRSVRQIGLGRFSSS